MLVSLLTQKHWHLCNMEKDQHFFQTLPISQKLREQILPFMPACHSQYRGSDYRNRNIEKGTHLNPCRKSELRKLLQLYCWSNPIHCSLGVTHPRAGSTCGNSEAGRNVSNAGNLSGAQGCLLHVNVPCQPQVRIVKKGVVLERKGSSKEGVASGTEEWLCWC